jgi:signal transduction histidine kinase/DNA-binding response OmpR family regulator
VTDAWAFSFVVAALAVALGLLVRAGRRIAALERQERELRAAAAARERAEAASLAKSRFLAVVSHEIRTPLNGVMGLAQLLGMTRLDPEQASYVDAIDGSSRALAALIDDILDFSRIEAGKLDLQRERFALAPLVEGVVELLAPRALAKELEIACFVSPDAPLDLVGDPARLRQVLINLVGNAVNYAARGGVGVRLLREGETLRIDVCDTGPGVPMAARDAIFEAFAQGDPSATRRQGGTGLGLAISRQLVELMGGALFLAQSSQEGSIFSVVLPAGTASGAVAPSRPLDGLRVLIVADSRFEAPYLAATLEAAGAVTVVCTAGEAPARLSRPAAFDATIVDCAPGAEAIAGIARAAKTARAGRLFLLFSPLERRAFGEAALRDFDGWLVKPVRRASLVARVAGVRSSPPAPARNPGTPARTLEGVDILVAEDNDINALILTRCLEKLGARTARARDGAQALAMAAPGARNDAPPFDLIVMDLFMPELDGREVARRVRDAEFRMRAPRTPIVMLTASAQEEDSRAAGRAGIDAYLTKPVDLATLAETIESLGIAPGSGVRGASAGRTPAGDGRGALFSV